jgi:hypothetical protein
MTDQFSVKKILNGLENNLGEDDYIEPLNILVNSLNKNKLNFFGELAFKHQLKKRLKVRKLVFEEFKNNSYQDPADPVFVIGLPRSGTTFLFNLLYQDKVFRSPLYWEIMKPLPMTKDKIEINKRIRKINRELCIGKTVIPKLKAMHAIKAEMPEECEQIATMHAKSFVYICMADVPEYAEYLKTCDFDSVFMWHKRFFQILETGKKPDKWLLKDPSHIGHIPSILKTYPNAKFIYIHRDPIDAIGSFCSLTKNIRSSFASKVNPIEIGETVINFWSHNVQQGLRDRSLIVENNIVDVIYDDFIKNPMQEIKSIYTHLNFDMSVTTENNMQNYLFANKGKSKSKHLYNTAEFDIDKEKIEFHFRDYMLKYGF